MNYLCRCVYNEAILVHAGSFWVFFKYGERSWDMTQQEGVSFFLQLLLRRSDQLLSHCYWMASLRNRSGQICVWISGRGRAGQSWGRLRTGIGQEGGGVAGQGYSAFWNAICFVTKWQRPTICTTWLVQHEQLFKWGNQLVPGSRLWEELPVSFLNWRNAYSGALSKYAYLVTWKAQSLSNNLSFLLTVIQ